jgi:mannose-6-phosphate isomerase
VALTHSIRFRPHFRFQVWGGRRLGEALGKELPSAEPCGESWEVSDHASHSSQVQGGPWAGRTLRDLMEAERAALLGPAADDYEVFPWLVKYLDARDWLSVQVHPDDEQAPRLWPGERGKTEAWFILDAAPDGRVYAGLQPGVDEAVLRRAVAEGNVRDCLHSFRPRPGDCLFLPAGVVHAVGGGVLMAEVQQTSDATFRLYDWGRRDAQGRPRQLHVEQALACIDWRAGPVRPLRAEGYPASEAEAPAAAVTQTLVRCRYFVLEYVRRCGPFTLGGTCRLQVVLAAHGRGRLLETPGPGPGERQGLAAGDSVVLPAALGPLSAHADGPLGLLVATLPD